MEKNLGHATAYGYAKSKGYTGTEEEYAELMASYATVAEEAAESAESASASATSASASATTATTKASEASQSATQAGTKASEASTSATQASASATSASQSASTATTKASEASASASTASTKASEASTSATTASSKASEASASATSAQTAQGLAESARDDAIDAKTDAESARDLAQQYAESINPEHIYSAYPTDTASGSVASFADGADDIPMKSVKVAIEPVQSGSGDPSPDNVRPISGWTGTNVVRSGKNLLNSDISAWSVSTYRYINDAVPADTPARFTFIDKDTSVDISEVNIGFSAERLDSGKSPTSFTWTIRNGEITKLDGQSNSAVNGNRGVLCSNVMIYPNTEEAFNALFSRYYIMVELGTTATEYEPYTGNTYSITFPSEAGTVYGGELDVTNGVLTVDRAMVTLDGSEVWNLQSINSYGIANFNTTINHYHAPNFRSLCNMLSPQTGLIANTQTEGYLVHQNGQDNYIRIFSFRASTVAELKTWLASNPIQLVYTLATPITYNLTPTEIKSLLGDNNVWADAGNTEVTYRADTKLYIEKKLGTEAPMIATDNIVSGSYFMVGSNLYKATANIASGAAVVVGTNAVAKTMAEALNEINA